MFIMYELMVVGKDKMDENEDAGEYCTLLCSCVSHRRKKQPGQLPERANMHQSTCGWVSWAQRSADRFPSGGALVAGQQGH